MWKWPYLKSWSPIGPRKFKRGIGSLFHPVLTLWGGGHIGSSRMEQSYCTSGFFRQRVSARNHSNYQPTPKRRSIIVYGKRENARHDKCVAVCVICFIFFSWIVLRFPNFPGNGTAISPPFFLKVLWLTCLIPEGIRSIGRYEFCILFLFICW